VVKLAIATGHAMQIFNYLHYSNDAGLLAQHWIVLEKIHTPRTEEISAIGRGREEKNCFW
jgi:hypothetical protein